MLAQLVNLAVFADRFFRNFRDGIRIGFTHGNGVFFRTVQQFIQFLGIKPQERQVKIGILQFLDFHRQEVVVPFGDFAGLVIGNAVCLNLFLRKVVGNHHRYFCQSQTLCCFHAGVSHNNNEVFVHHNRLLKAELLDRSNDK